MGSLYEDHLVARQRLLQKLAAVWGAVSATSFSTLEQIADDLILNRHKSNQIRGSYMGKYVIYRAMRYWKIDSLR